MTQLTGHVLYRLYGESGEPLYFGITNNPDGRMAAHSKRSTWWDEVESVKLDYFDSREELKAAERDAIRAESPAFNYQWNRSPKSRPRVEELDGSSYYLVEYVDDGRFDMTDEEREESRAAAEWIGEFMLGDRRLAS